jgi:hypothetical protein
VRIETWWRTTSVATNKKGKNPDKEKTKYLDRCDLLIEIAVSTPLRTTSIANRKFMLAERCRYGTRDFALTEKAIRLRLSGPHSKLGDEMRVSQD